MIDIDVTGEKKMGRITAITAGKGGMGKTMFAVNLASCLAMKGETTLLIDMNSGFRNLDICLGLENQVMHDRKSADPGSPFSCALSSVRFTESG